jgi:hypothetical protein
MTPRRPPAPATARVSAQVTPPSRLLSDVLTSGVPAGIRWRLRLTSARFVTQHLDGCGAVTRVDHDGPRSRLLTQLAHDGFDVRRDLLTRHLLRLLRVAGVDLRPRSTQVRESTREYGGSTYPRATSAVSARLPTIHQTVSDPNSDPHPIANRDARERALVCLPPHAPGAYAIVAPGDCPPPRLDLLTAPKRCSSTYQLGTSRDLAGSPGDTARCPLLHSQTDLRSFTQR